MTISEQSLRDDYVGSVRRVAQLEKDIESLTTQLIGERALAAYLDGRLKASEIAVAERAVVPFRQNSSSHWNEEVPF